MTLGAVLAMTGGTVGLAMFVGGVVLARRARRDVARARSILRSARSEREAAQRIRQNARPSPTTHDFAVNVRGPLGWVHRGSA